MTPALLLWTLSVPARADVALEPDPGTRFLTHALRIEGLDAHPGYVVLAYDAGAELSTWRAFHAGAPASQELGWGGANRGPRMGAPGLHLLPRAAYDAWLAQTTATIQAQETACAERGEGCMHISRFVPSFPPPVGAVSCGLSLQVQGAGPEDGPDRVEEVLRLEAASDSTCSLARVGQELSREGKPVAAGSGARCDLVGGAASLLAGAGLLLGLGRRRRSGPPGRADGATAG
ncbi:hypothetical protein L6R53_20870 [Myxococcota bacterium]|nr:hypothetical protein [Myxococcota bacterium]